jgi:hypothetical protein
MRLRFRVGGRKADGCTSHAAALYLSIPRTGVSGQPDDPPIRSVTSVFLGRQLCQLHFLFGKQL